jgi:hypothetical protein
MSKQEKNFPYLRPISEGKKENDFTSTGVRYWK